jgi:threonine dehydrogenase-like Zn-dependent dehydrogenase
VHRFQNTSTNSEARANAIRSTKVWGTMYFVGEGGDVKIDVSPMLLRRQMTLVASWTFSNIIQAECARFCVERKIDVDKLHPSLEAGAGGRGLQAVRQTERQEGGVFDVGGGMPPRPPAITKSAAPPLWPGLTRP